MSGGSSRALRSGVGENAGASGDAEAFEPGSLLDGTDDGSACLAGDGADMLEINVAGQVLLARLLQHGGETMRVNSLERVAGRRAFVAVGLCE